MIFIIVLLLLCSPIFAEEAALDETVTLCVGDLKIDDNGKQYESLREYIETIIKDNKVTEPEYFQAGFEPEYLLNGH